IISVRDMHGKILESHTCDSHGRGLTSSRAAGVESVTRSCPNPGLLFTAVHRCVLKAMDWLRFGLLETSTYACAQLEADPDPNDFVAVFRCARRSRRTNNHKFVCEFWTRRDCGHDHRDEFWLDAGNQHSQVQRNNCIRHILERNEHRSHGT